MKNFNLKLTIDLCFWGWLCFSAFASIAILIRIFFLKTDIHWIFNIMCMLGVICFIPNYIKQIVLTIKKDSTTHSNRKSSAVSRSLKNGIIMLPSILLSSLLAGLSLLFENWKMLFIILSVLTITIGMGMLAMKSIGKLRDNREWIR